MENNGTTCLKQKNEVNEYQATSNFNTNIKIENLIRNFALAIQHQDINLLSEILLDVENYNIQNEEYETIAVGKSDFLKWITPILQSTPFESIRLDQCLYCKIGNPVFIINNGTIPRKVKDISELEKTGLMLDFAEDRISGITFCYTFLKHENESKFQSNLNKIFELENQGMSKKDAFKAILGYDYNEDIF